MTRPVTRPFASRVDAIYFLASAGALASEQAGIGAAAASAAVCEALETIGVSNQELRAAGHMGRAGVESRWETMKEKESANDTAKP